MLSQLRATSQTSTTCNQLTGYMFPKEKYFSSTKVILLIDTFTW